MSIIFCIIQMNRGEESQEGDEKRGEEKRREEKNGVERGGE